MKIVKPMNKIDEELKVASRFPRLICQGSARSVPSTRYHLINTPTPPFFIFKTLQIISVPPWKPETGVKNPHKCLSGSMRAEDRVRN
jgi:hypothetical protein